MNRVIAEKNFTPNELEYIESLSAELELLPSTVRLLYARGQTDAPKIKRFLSAGKHNFTEPFLLNGMREFRERIVEAKQNNESVLIYGDYDADGICALAILTLALKNFGVSATAFVPERAEGYGLSIENIEKIAQNLMPDLIITVDCGISSYSEVSYIQELGIDVIVTDHHELPSRLPDCLIISPKLKEQDYAFEHLCGAGIALKAAYALDSKFADSLIDLAAIATVADSVPLYGENRDIAAEGIKMIGRPSCRPCIAELLNGQTQITSQTIAFSIAPKINAAGRLGKAELALRLFLSEDRGEIKTLADEIKSLNGERQNICAEMFTVAAQLAKEECHKNVIMLASDKFSNGFTGIAASKICEAYSKPTIIFAKSDGFYKGSARSIEGINIYDAVCSASDFIVEFGGHAQAAGITLSRENFDAFYQKVDGYLQEHYSPDAYVPMITIAENISKPINMRFAEEIAMLEPFGVGNKQPLFMTKAQKCKVSSLKDKTAHISVGTQIGDLVYFNGLKNQQLLQSNIEKTIIFETAVSVYRGRKYLKNYLKNVITNGESKANSWLLLSGIRQFLQSDEMAVSADIEYEEVTTEYCNKMLKESIGGFGKCFILSDEENQKHYLELDKYRKEYFSLSQSSCHNTVLFSPSDTDLSEFQCAIYLDKPPKFQALHADTVLVNTQLSGCGYIHKIDAERQALLDIYFYLKGLPSVYGQDSAEVYENLQPPYTAEQFIFALEVFCELGLISFIGERVHINGGQKVSLENSEIYRKIKLEKAKI